MMCSFSVVSQMHADSIHEDRGELFDMLWDLLRHRPQLSDASFWHLQGCAGDRLALPGCSASRLLVGC